MVIGYQAENKRSSAGSTESAGSASQARAPNGAEGSTGGRSSRMSSDECTDMALDPTYVQQQASPMGGMGQLDADRGIPWEKRTSLHPMDAVYFFRRGDVDAREWGQDGGNMAVVVDEASKASYQYRKIAADLHQWQMMTAEGSRARQTPGQAHHPYRPPSSSGQNFMYERVEALSSSPGTLRQPADSHVSMLSSQQPTTMSDVAFAAAVNRFSDSARRVHTSSENAGRNIGVHKSSSPHPKYAPFPLEREMKYDEKSLPQGDGGVGSDRFLSDDSSRLRMEPVVAVRSHPMEAVPPQDQQESSAKEKDVPTTPDSGRMISVAEAMTYQSVLPQEKIDFIVSETAPHSRYIGQAGSAVGPGTSSLTSGSAGRQPDHSFTQSLSQYEALSDEDVWKAGKSSSGDKQQQQL